MSSAVCFNLDQSKVLWFGNRLMVLMALETKAFLKALWKKEKMVTGISFSYSAIYLCHLLSSSIIPLSICMFISCVRNFSLISGWIWIKFSQCFSSCNQQHIVRVLRFIAASRKKGTSCYILFHFL